jgi:hypothetical protein
MTKERNPSGRERALLGLTKLNQHILDVEEDVKELEATIQQIKEEHAQIVKNLHDDDAEP